jgi:hypothetical protein
MAADIAPEDIEERPVRYSAGVVEYFHGLGVPRDTRRDFLVNGVLFLPSGVAGNALPHTLELFKGVLHAPETSAGERGAGQPRALVSGSRHRRADNEHEKNKHLHPGHLPL